MAFAARMLVLFALAVTLGASSRTYPAAVLKSMRAAAGPVWSAHFVSISRLSYQGVSATVSSESQGIPFQLRRCTGELCDGTYFDGTHLFAVNMNNTALPQSNDSEPYLRSLRIVACLAFLAPNFTQDGGQIVDAGYAVVGGKKFRTILVADRTALAMKLFVDPQTWLLRYARDLGGDDTFEYLDYRKVSGFTVPFQVMHDGKVLERYDDRTPVATAFVPPRGLTPAFKGAPQAVAIDPDHVTPVFPCSLGGVAVRCLLDTGNSGISISSELAARLAAPVVGEHAVRGLGGYSTQIVRAGPLVIGNATYPDGYYFVLNDVHQYGYDVVVGTDVLASTTVQLDAMAHTIRFGAAPLASTITVPLSFENFVPVVNVELGSVPARLLVDTGDESNINLAYDFYQKHTSLFSITDRRNVRGIGAESVELLGSIPQVTVGTYTTGPQTIGTTQTLVGTAFGHLGAAFLGQFDVEFDYSAAELRLSPARG